MAVPLSADTNLVELLAEHRAALLDTLARIPEDQRGRRPAPERWSAAEILEHLAHVESGMARLIELRGREPVPPDAATPPEAQRAIPALAATMRNRAVRVEAPERLRPAGTLTAAQALARLEEKRAKLLAALAAADPRSLDYVVHEHPVLGLLTLRAFVAVVAFHEGRHTEQLREIAERAES